MHEQANTSLQLLYVVMDIVQARCYWQADSGSCEPTMTDSTSCPICCVLYAAMSAGLLLLPTPRLSMMHTIIRCCSCCCAASTAAASADCGTLCCCCCCTPVCCTVKLLSGIILCCCTRSCNCQRQPLQPHASPASHQRHAWSSAGLNSGDATRC